MSDRDVNSAFNWVEATTGGRIVGKQEHLRWRPQWFLNVELPDGETRKLLLRGWRTPGIVETEEKSRDRLRREAAILVALHQAPLRSPRYYGYDEKGGWILMECVVGDDLLTEVTDVARQTDLFRQYIDDIVTLHAIDPAGMGLPDTIYRPADPESNASWNYKLHREKYRAASCGPDPLLELAWWWLDNHRPAPVERYSLCTGDIGANQFLFEGDRYASLFDVEMGYIGDPLQDIGMMRYRNMCYPVAEFNKILDHYFIGTGRPVDVASIHYWTIVGLIGVGPSFAPLLADPDPAKPIDMTLIWGMQARRRGLVTALQQIYGLPVLPVPPVPPSVPSVEDQHHAFLVRSINTFYAPQAGEQEAHHLRFLLAHAEIALRCSRSGAVIEALDCDALWSVLGERPVDRASGLARLQDAILAAPETDLEARLNVLFGIECRREYLLEPALHAVGFPSFAPLDNFPIGR